MKDSLTTEGSYLGRFSEPENGSLVYLVLPNLPISARVLHGVLSSFTRTSFGIEDTLDHINLMLGWKASADTLSSEEREYHYAGGKGIYLDHERDPVIGKPFTEFMRDSAERWKGFFLSALGGPDKSFSPAFAWAKDMTGNRSFVSEEKVQPYIKQLAVEDPERYDVFLGRVLDARLSREKIVVDDGTGKVSLAHRPGVSFPLLPVQVPILLSTETHASKILNSSLFIPIVEEYLDKKLAA